MKDRALVVFYMYMPELFQSFLVIGLALVLYFLFRYFFNMRPVNRRLPHTIVMITILLLAALFLIDVWGERLPVIGFVEKYTKQLPGYSTIILLSFSGLASYLLHLSLLRRLSRGDQDLTTLHKVRRAARWAGLGLFIILAGTTLMISIGWTEAGTFLGLVGAGIALSMQETVLCIVGWLHIIVNRVYDIGDRVEIDNYKGDIINITLTHTQLLEVGGSWVFGEQSTGRIHTIPNSQAFRNSVFNYTYGFPFVWSEMAVTVTYESNWQKGKQIMLDIAAERSDEIISEVKKRIDVMQKDFAINFRHLTPTVYTTIQDAGIRLELRFLSPVRDRRGREHLIAQEILKAFDHEKDVDFAYPTTRIFRMNEEHMPKGRGFEQ